jgi:GrpB-like predicted nucleotidyltransferase (UPF0157 family)
VAAEHIGSTAVPGLAAKPVVDLLAVVEAVDGPCDDLVWRMEAAGYTLRVREPGHLAFRGAGGEANVHLWPAGAPEIPRYLALREALRASAADRDRYAAVKRVLAGRVWADTNHYAAAKGPVIASILRRAGV